MLRCIQLAKNGLGTTYPNPLVGCVIVYENKIIGEGWHEQSGMPHAEVNAITSVKNQSLLKNATIYVSLEPCSHFGKTPPCANLIIEKGIRNVIIGSMDPNPKVAGNGIKLLKDHECNVVEGILEKECNDLNKRFFTFFKKHRPYIILKWAETSDGFISPKNKIEKSPVWIDKNLKIPLEANVFDNSSKTIVITELKKENKEHLFYETIDFSKNIAQQICEVIYRHKIQSLIVEGGAKTLQTFIDKNLWDEARIFKGISLFKEGTKAPLLNGNLVSETKIKQDTIKIVLND